MVLLYCILIVSGDFANWSQFVLVPCTVSLFCNKRCVAKLN